MVAVLDGDIFKKECVMKPPTMNLLVTCQVPGAVLKLPLDHLCGPLSKP